MSMFPTTSTADLPDRDNKETLFVKEEETNDAGRRGLWGSRSGRGGITEGTLIVGIVVVVHSIASRNCPSTFE